MTFLEAKNIRRIIVIITPAGHKARNISKNVIGRIEGKYAGSRVLVTDTQTGETFYDLLKDLIPDEPITAEEEQELNRALALAVKQLVTDVSDGDFAHKPKGRFLRELFTVEDLETYAEMLAVGTCQ